MQIGPDRVGPRGLFVLALTVLAAAVLALVGSTHGPTLPTGLGPAPVAQPRRRSSRPAARTPSPARKQTPVRLGPMLSSTQYASFAYRLYPGPRSASAQQALAGFRVSITPQGHHITLTVVSPGSATPLHRVYAASDRVYFIEASFGDDAGNQELNLGDDGLVVTNTQGRIIEG